MRKKWEYMVLCLADYDDNADALEERFDCHGREGWQLVAVNNTHAYFKRRPLKDAKDLIDRVRGSVLPQVVASGLSPGQANAAAARLREAGCTVLHPCLASSQAPQPDLTDLMPLMVADVQTPPSPPESKKSPLPVAINCKIKRGVFSDERVFWIDALGEPYKGTASRIHCWDASGKPLDENEPGTGEIAGKVSALELESEGSDILVSIPDGAVITVSAALRVPRPAVRS